MPAWPETLPRPLISGYSETLPDQVLRSKMDKGPPKRRRISTFDNRPFSMSFQVSGALAGTLEDFYMEDLGGGSLSFTAQDARTGNTVTLAFTKPPVMTPRGGDIWNIQCEFEKS